MSSPESPANLPAPIAEALAGIPKALIPACIKALDRLVGAAVDIPAAWLAQQRVKIEAQTQAFALVEGAIAKAVASEASGDEATVQRAVDVLVRKSYRKQTNRDAVATAALEDLRAQPEQPTTSAHAPPAPELDEDWLNIFERYAEDASSERMQKLWGRVLAGEVRRPGRFSPRTLRFLSEFSQADALTFENFCKHSFGEGAPNKLVNPPERKDIRDLMYLEASGLIQGATGLGLRRTFHFNQQGNAFLREGDLVIVFKGTPNSSVASEFIGLTPLGQELVGLLPGRDARAAARAVAHAMRKPELEEAYLGAVINQNGDVTLMEVLWQKDAAAAVEPAQAPGA